MKISLTLSVFFVLLLSFGCAGMREPSRIYRAKAMKYENRDELQLALQNWEIAGNLSPGDVEIEKKIDDIKVKISRMAEKHFKRGLNYYRNNSLNAARKEFLIALRYNPDHAGALKHLKSVLTEKEYTLYKVEEGDTLKGIAARIYNDPGKDFLIAYFNGLETKTIPTPGSLLKIPVLEPLLTTPPIDIEKDLEKANRLFDTKMYEEAISAAHQVLEYDPANEEAGELVNASYYELGRNFIRQGKDLESLDMFSQVPPDYRDVQKIMSEVRNRVKALAEGYYRRGVKHFINEELKEAIKEWEKTLSLDPDHQNAKDDLQKARNLLERLKNIN